MKHDFTASLSINTQTPISAVWHALTNPAMIKKYFFGREAISDWKEGSTILFRGERGGKYYEDKANLLIVEPYKILQYNYWSAMSGAEEKPENYMLITYELYEEEELTTLTITQENISDEQRIIHSEQNWRKAIRDLQELLENYPPVPAPGT